MIYECRIQHPETNETVIKHFKNVQEICEYFEISRPMFFKIQSGEIKCNSKRTLKWNYIKFTKLESDSKYFQKKKMMTDYENLTNMKTEIGHIIDDLKQPLLSTVDSA